MKSMLEDGSKFDFLFAVICLLCGAKKPYRVGSARLAVEARRGRMKEKPVSWYTHFYSAAAPLLSALA